MWNGQGMQPILNISMVPYGNAQESQQGDQWVFTCQHGDQECQGNLIESCVIGHYPDTNTHLTFINCMESASDPVSGAQGCATQQGLDWNAINTCVNGDEGNALEHNMAVRTENLSPPHQYVPWVVINGQYSQQAESSLLKVVCAAYAGPPPAGCNSAFRTYPVPTLLQEPVRESFTDPPVCPPFEEPCEYLPNKWQCCTDGESCVRNVGCRCAAAKPTRCAKTGVARHKPKFWTVRQAPPVCPPGEQLCEYLPGKYQCCTDGESCLRNVGCRC